MNAETWKEKIRKWFEEKGRFIRREAPANVYGVFCASTLMPVISAMNLGQYDAVSALYSVLGPVGAGVIANRIHAWMNRSEEELEVELQTEAEENAELKQALDNLLIKLEVPQIVHDAIGEGDREWFRGTLGEELERLGNRDRYKAVLTGSGVLAQGPGATAAGAGGIAARDIYGPVTINRTKQILSDPTAHDPTSLQKSYLNRLLESAQNLSLGGVDPKAASEAERRLSLAAVYTALLTQTSEPHERLFPGELREREIRRLSAVEQLNNHKQLVLLGDPGSGKSTFVNFVGLCMAGEILKHKSVNLNLLRAPLPQEEDRKEKEQELQPWDHGPLLPVLVILRDFAARGLPAAGERTTAEHLWNFIASELKTAALEKYTPHLHRELTEYGGLILLDGLDEVPEAEQRRTQIKQAVEDFASAFPQCRILVTSRTYAYQKQEWHLPGFAEAVLVPFTEGQIGNFVDRWYAHIAEKQYLQCDNAQGQAQLLKRAVFNSDRLFSLAERPLLLTLMASLHSWRGGSLPERREELYADAVELLLDWWESRRVVRDGQGNTLLMQPSLAEWLRVDREKVRRLLNELAYQAHAAQPDLVGAADIPAKELITRLVDLTPNPEVKPRRLLEHLSQRAGLLVPRGVDVYSFPHRTFQEYLAACHLTEQDYPDRVAELARTAPDRWREVALLAGAKAGRGTPYAVWSLVDALCFCELNDSEDDPANLWGVHLAGQVLVESANLEQVSDRNRPKVECVRRGLVQILKSGKMPAIERAHAGRTLAKLGDPRCGVLVPEMIELLDVPSGPFIMGDQDSRFLYTIPYAYKISRYPITNAQFLCFVKAGGYQRQSYWREAEEARVWKDGRVRIRETSTFYEKPVDYGEPFSLSNHPVVEVTWYEALAFTRWLTEVLRENGRLPSDWEMRLPNEPEWEKAARGTAGNIYPWGSEIDSEKANYDKTGIGSTSAVGCFPNGVSPYECLDMVGNVWEWTRSLYESYPYPENCREKRNRERLDANFDASRVLRGGGFYNGGSFDFVRCAVRLWFEPDFRIAYIGFRVVASPLKPLNSVPLNF